MQDPPEYALVSCVLFVIAFVYNACAIVCNVCMVIGQIISGSHTYQFWGNKTVYVKWPTKG